MTAILVTGASSGIGRACSAKLCSGGLIVYAAVRRPQDGEGLRAQIGENLRPVLLDVTDAGSIERAAREVAAQVEEDGLAGLVNNAGIGQAGPLEYFPLADVRQQFEVNVFGPLAVTQAFLPLIRRGRGRIINIGSIGDRITMPFGGPLCATKRAVASLSEALRLELHPWGIHVCLIEPASISTPAVEKLAASAIRLVEDLPPEGGARYGKLFRAFLDRSVAREKAGSPPEVVAAVVQRALTERHPRTRYLVGRDARLLALLAHLPDRILDSIRLRIFGLPSTFGALAAKGEHLKATAAES